MAGLSTVLTGFGEQVVEASERSGTNLVQLIEQVQHGFSVRIYARQLHV